MTFEENKAVMTPDEFHLRLWEAIAEDDFDICECCDCGKSDLTEAGIDRIVGIADAVADDLFGRIAALEFQIVELEARIADERAHWTMTSESGVLNG